MYGYFTEAKYMGDMPYTDLAAERHRPDLSIPGVEYAKEEGRGCLWERIRISSTEGARSIGRPMGLYDTLCLGRIDSLSPSEIENGKNEIAAEICRMIEETEIFPRRILIAGLGNSRLTPDAVGYESATKVRATMHIKEQDPLLFNSLGCSEIAVLTPGVASFCGLDAAVVVRGVCDMIRPDAVIAIDALCSRSTERLGSTVQISNTGISPGSGLGNPKTSIGKETLGIPVIAIGVPTVIDSRMLSNKEEFSAPMFVSPKEINDIVSSASEMIGSAINRAIGIYS